MNNDYYEIQRLLNLYCHYLDKAEFEKWANLFSHGRIVFDIDPSQTPIVFDRDPNGLAEFERSSSKLYDGATRTLHLSTNAIIDIEPCGNKARCESNILVLQQTENLPLQPIAVAIDSDKFEKADGNWRFIERRAQPLLMGDMSHHVNISITS